MNIHNQTQANKQTHTHTLSYQSCAYQTVCLLFLFCILEIRQGMQFLHFIEKFYKVTLCQYLIVNRSENLHTVKALLMQTYKYVCSA